MARSTKDNNTRNKEYASSSRLNVREKVVSELLE